MGQKTDIRNITREEHKMMKDQIIPELEPTVNSFGVCNMLLETVMRLMLSIKLRFLGPKRNKVPIIQTLAAKAFDLDLL